MKYAINLDFGNHEYTVQFEDGTVKKIPAFYIEIYGCKSESDFSVGGKTTSERRLTAESKNSDDSFLR